MNNKNISVWRGDNTPPTQYHLWLKNNGKLYVNIDEQWQEIDKDSISQITEILNQHTTKLDNHQTALDNINTLHSKLWTPGKGNWSIMSQGVKDSIGEDLTKGALGTYSYAEGQLTTAAGDASHAEGKNTIANGDSAHAQGRFNVGSKYYIHSTGIGNENERKNAEYIYVNTDNVADPRNGYTYIYGIGDYDGINTDITTYKSLQEVMSGIDSTLKVKADLVDGKIPLEQLGNLDMVLFEVVRELPTTNIKKHIYLMKVSELESGAKNLYAEYIYTGDVTATYDASKWEKLGVKQIETDLSDYYTKEETDSQIQAVKNKFPLQVTSFTASPSVCAVGTTNVTLKWTYNNEDINPITSQSLNDVTLDKALRTKSESVSSDTAITKTFTLKANALSKTVTVYIVNNSYYGVVSAGTTTITDTTGLTVLTQYGRSATIAFTQANQKIVYLYPSVFGDLTSIKDNNGFEGISGFDKQSLTLNGISYNLYISKIPATSNVTLTFK